MAHRYKIIIFIVLAIIISVVCLQIKKKPQKLTKKMVYRMAFRTDIKTLDPANVGDLYSHIVVSQIYEPLLQYAYLKRPYELEPCLAEKMPEISSDNLIYTFKIKNKVYFQDDICFPNGKGKELIASDFVYSFKRLADIKNISEGWWIFDGMIKGLNEFREQSKKDKKTNYNLEVEGLKVLNNYTFQIKLTRNYPQLLYVLAMSYTSAVPCEAIEKYGNEIISHPIGTGPYKLQQWIRNSKLILVKNPNFRNEFYPSEGEIGDKEKGLLIDANKKMPFIDKVDISFILEDQPYWLNFMKANLDAAGIPKDNFQTCINEQKELKPDMIKKGIILTKTPEPDTTYIGFNMNHSILGKNKYLRQAISLAYDTSKTIKLFYNDCAIAAQGPIPPNIAGYDSTLKNSYREYNLTKAKELLIKAGYPNGKGLPVFIYENSGSDTTSRQMAEYFVKQMSQIGIKIEINNNTWPQFLQKLKTKSATIFGLAWIIDYPDAENFLQLFYGPNSSPGPNSTNFNHLEYNKLYEKIKYLSDSPKRREIIKKMVSILTEECPWIFGTHRIAYGLSYKWNKNYKPHTFNYALKYKRIDMQIREKMLKKEIN
ncbi:MAG: ABC transporter substrate-binding protein [bacterium]